MWNLIFTIRAFPTFLATLLKEVVKGKNRLNDLSQPVVFLESQEIGIIVARGDSVVQLESPLATDSILLGSNVSLISAILYAL